MSLSSSLNAAVSGLQSNATRLATISDNIANSATYGYRRAQTNFHAMVVNNSGMNAAQYTAGGVTTSTTRLVDQGGQLITTANPTDLAVSGNGFLPVMPPSALNGNQDAPMLLVTTGSFRVNSDGFLVDPAGNVLLGWPAAADGTIPTYPRTTTDGLEPIRIDDLQSPVTPTSQMSLIVNLPASATQAGSDVVTHDMALSYVDALGLQQSLNATFTSVVDPDEATNSWVLTLTDPANGDDVIAEYEVTFNADPDTGGTLAGVTPIGNSPPYDPETGAIQLQIGDQPIDLMIGVPGSNTGTTQRSDSFLPVNITHDGVAAGNLVGIVVDDRGHLQAVFDTGVSMTLYQIPVVDVPNPNGLTAHNDQTWGLSPESGAFFLWDANDGPAGGVRGYTLQESATDVALELTNLIQTQRAYSSNAKVVQTVDEMLQETTNLKR